MQLPGVQLANNDSSLTVRLRQSPAWFFILYVSVTSFTVYACMYGFRKPFTSSSFQGVTLLGIDYKYVLVISQTIGYMLSKFYGIRVIAGMQPQKRAGTIVKLIIAAWLSLFFFALVPPPYNFIFMFINGLPLGMIWGLVFGFLEGRRATELMGAILATSFIFASGLAKTAGKWLMINFNITQWWMPFAAGGLFIVPLLAAVWFLQKTPAPNADDIAQRTIRNPMTKQQRKDFIRHFGFALVPVIIAYVLLTILRDFSEDFSNELWNETGYQDKANIFAQTSTVISLIVLAVVGGFFIIRNNYKAFQLNHTIILIGFGITLVSTFLYNLHILSPIAWFTSAAAGLYLGYVPYNCFYFERLLAAYKVPGNVGFVMYIADAFGYLGTVAVLLVKGMVHIKYSWVDFFTFLFYTSAIIGVVLVIWGSLLFAKIYKRNTI